MWLFFGWGTKSKTWDIGNGQSVIVAWNYFHFFACPIITSRVTWHLVGDVRSEDRQITKEEAMRLAGGKELDIGAWSRYGLLYAIGYVGAGSAMVSAVPLAIYPLVAFPICIGLYTLFQDKMLWKRFLKGFAICLALMVVFLWWASTPEDFWTTGTFLGAAIFAGLIALLAALILKAFSDKSQTVQTSQP